MDHLGASFRAQGKHHVFPAVTLITLPEMVSPLMFLILCCFCLFVVVLVTQLCLTLWEPMDCSPPGSSVHGTSRQEYWSGLPFASPDNLPDPRIEPRSPALQADSLPSEPSEKPTYCQVLHTLYCNRFIRFIRFIIMSCCLTLSFLFFLSYWSIVDLECFRSTAKWLLYIKHSFPL